MTLIPSVVRRLFQGCLLLIASGLAGAADLPIFDAHLHYNVEATSPYPVDKVVELLRRHQVSGVLANSRPNDGTQALRAAKAKGLTVVPFIRPYIVQPDRYTWFQDPRIEALIHQEFKRGGYRGIGEFHLFGDDAKHPQVKRIVDFAVEHGLWLHAHADEVAIDTLFAHNAKARIIWAHSGFTTPPERLRDFLQRYPQLIGELSFRYDVTDNGKIAPAWRKLFDQFPERFVLGSDTWVNSRWDQYGEIMQYYRDWVPQLPPAVAAQLAYRNAERIFGVSLGQ